MITNPELNKVLGRTGPILLDFDGPVTHLFIDGRNRMVADRMRTALPVGIQLPNDLRDTHDPLIFLRWAGQTLGESILDQVEAACVEGEIAAAEASVPTPGVTELLIACAKAGRPVIVVSNNAEQPIRHFLDRHALDHLITGIVARIPGKPELMKPDPTSVWFALDSLGTSPGSCAMIGDSVSDIQVCKATGVHSIGFAKTPRRGAELRDAGAEAIVTSIRQIAEYARLKSMRPEDDD